MEEHKRLFATETYLKLEQGMEEALIQICGSSSVWCDIRHSLHMNRELIFPCWKEGTYLFHEEI